MEEKKSEVIDTGLDELQARLENSVAVVRLNRPASLNALTYPLLISLGDLLTRLKRDDSVHCILLTGAGRAFCAGAEMSDLDGPERRGDLADIRYRIDVQRAVVEPLYRMPKPVLASLPGPAAGGGLGIALACDLRIASDNAVLATAFTKIGLTGDCNIAYTMTGLVGAAKARELLFLPRKIEAKEALELGLVNRVVPEAALEDEAIGSLAAELAAGPTDAIGAIKENLNRAREQGFDECLQREVAALQTALRGDDHRERVRAFKEKRAPRIER